VLSTIRGWAKAGWTDASGNGFAAGKDPIAWVGHWQFDAYTKAFPGDVRIVPLPNFGRSTATGMGSWQWGITAGATDGDAAWRFLSFLLRPSQVLRMTQANGSVPATLSAIRRSPRFAPGGPEHLYIEQLENRIARPRPQTPAYPALSAAWSKAFQDVILRLRPVKPELDAAARAAQQDLADHDYYRRTGP
jgi:multiple sugar transport system substrate-binding protein